MGVWTVQSWRGGKMGSDRNGKLTPNDVTPNSNKKVWWQCENGHEWEAVISNRTRGNGCPFCYGRYALDGDNLQIVNPALARQWHPTKNQGLTPADIKTGSNKKVWWQCEKGHEWEAVISNRTSGSGCPICKQGFQTSFPEQAIYFYLKGIFPDTISRHKFNGRQEIDVFIPNLMFGIEYDGIYYHKNKNSDIKKEQSIASEGISFLRVKEIEDAPQKCFQENNVIYCRQRPSNGQLNDVVNSCFEYISKKITHTFYYPNIDVKRDRLQIYDLYIKGEEEESLLAKYPELAKQWHPTTVVSFNNRLCYCCHIFSPITSCVSYITEKRYMNNKATVQTNFIFIRDNVDF